MAVGEPGSGHSIRRGPLDPVAACITDALFLAELRSPAASLHEADRTDDVSPAQTDALFLGALKEPPACTDIEEPMTLTDKASLLRQRALSARRGHRNRVMQVDTTLARMRFFVPALEALDGQLQFISSEATYEIGEWSEARAHGRQALHVAYLSPDVMPPWRSRCKAGRGETATAQHRAVVLEVLGDGVVYTVHDVAAGRVFFRRIQPICIAQRNLGKAPWATPGSGCSTWTQRNTRRLEDVTVLHQASNTFGWKLADCTRSRADTCPARDVGGWWVAEGRRGPADWAWHGTKTAKSET